MDLAKLIGTVSAYELESYMSLLPKVWEMSPFSRGEQAPKFLRTAGFYVISRKPPIVQTELTSEYLNSLSEFPLA